MNKPSTEAAAKAAMARSTAPVVGRLPNHQSISSTPTMLRRLTAVPSPSALRFGRLAVTPAANIEHLLPNPQILSVCDVHVG